MDMKKYFAIPLMALLIFSACEDMIDPVEENIKNESQLYTDARYAQGLLFTGYRTIPAYYNNSEYATDDAVTNELSNAYLKIAVGGWTSNYNPTSYWNNGFNAIQHINLFMDIVDSVNWTIDENPRKLFAMRMKGEAYGIRAMHMFYLLQAHSGFDRNGQLMGFPILDKFLDPKTADFNKSRNTFDECVKRIYQDLDSAEKYLPIEYLDITNAALIPDIYKPYASTTAEYNRVMGIAARQLFNGLIAKAFRAKTALLAASPAYQHTSNSATWEQAATVAGEIITYKKGLTGLPASGLTYYANTAEIDAIKEGSNPPEILWRSDKMTNIDNQLAQQTQNFPPSLFGNGRMNPTQGLVDAFPMTNGYPINHESSGYDPALPYTNRDSRFGHYIIFNGATAGINNTVINTFTGVKDGINKISTSTRTGYYMKKRMRQDVNIDPAFRSGKDNYIPRIRFTELYLIYAEAANEAWGPKGTGTSSTLSAYDVIKHIRTRAKIGTTNNHAYLEECALDKDKMRELIRNERRLELCFESFRFWDLRRWKLNLNETAYGLNLIEGEYVPFDVEIRAYEPYMYYGPIPYSEPIKFNKLIQNEGWN
jgi:starch-binding outer membrane protein, SusD/RagB family